MSKPLLYAKSHEWARVETDPAGGKTATVGLTAFALEALTDLVHIELPQVGRKVKAGEPFGEIVAVNSAVVGILDHLADDPYDAGWFIKIKIGNEAGLANLLDEAAYKKQCEEEQH